MKSRRLIIFLLVAGLSAIGYGLTVCPTVEFIDSGELAQACKNLGVAHPTGYPLYTLLGRLAAIFLWGELIFRLNWLSLFFTAAAAGFIYLTLSKLLAIPKATNRIYQEIIAGCVALFMAFSPVWWDQGTTNEVYSLNLLLISISLWALFKWLENIRGRERWLLISVYGLGLCFTNHLSVIYLLPAYIFIVLISLRGMRGKARALYATLFFFVFPAALYLILPLRAHFRPFLNWGAVDDAYFLYKHVSGWQYRIWMFDSPLGELIGNLGQSARLYWQQFGWFGLTFIVIGMTVEALRRWKIAVFAALIIIFNLIYVINYEIADIEAYYLPMLFISAIFLAAGIDAVFRAVLKTTPSKNYIKIMLIGLIIILPLSNFVDNFFVADRSRKTFAHRGVLDIGDSMAANGLAIVENWDFYSPWLYLHFDRSYRPDMTLLDKELMRRSWYIDFIRRYHPRIYERSRSQFDEFLRRVEPYERGRSFDPQMIDQAYYGMLQAIVKNESAVAPVYTNVLSDEKFVAGSALIPDGILFRFGDASGFLERPYVEFDSSYWGDRYIYRDVRVAYLLSYYARAFDSRQKYCAYFGRNEEAAHYARQAAQVKSIMTDIENRKD